jgi:YabG peptidase U57.
MLQVGDCVVRKKYNRDILFEIYHLENGIAYLKGIEIRLIADSYLEDLELATFTVTNLTVDESQLFRRDDVIKGKVLHIDGDSRYLDMCLSKYRDLAIIAYGYHLKETEMSTLIYDLLEKHQPDLLVITGHDALNNKGERDSLDSYLHTRDFIETIKIAREYQKDKDSLIIFAGACQSNYELLIASGANFASSPNRINIHCLDPVYIISQIAQESVKNYVNLEKIIKNTSNKDRGVGGIDTKGVARKIYPLNK